MADFDIFATINALSDEEEQLYEHAGDGHGLTAEELDRVAAIWSSRPLLRPPPSAGRPAGGGTRSGRGRGTVARSWRPMSRTRVP
jgi:hypothetical protein